MQPSVDLAAFLIEIARDGQAGQVIRKWRIDHGQIGVGKAETGSEIPVAAPKALCARPKPPILLGCRAPSSSIST
jgi:hypothetical protein